MTETTPEPGTEVAARDQAQPAVPATAPGADLVHWAEEAGRAHQVAQSLAKTSFVPSSMRGRPEDITAAILTGREVGLPPMAAVRSIDLIQGTPALRAHALRALLQSHGHAVQLVESTGERCVMRGRRRGDEEWQEVTWTIQRAEQLGLTGKDQWKKQPQTMLIARATGEICRLVASDAIHAMPYAAEELGTPGRSAGGPPAPQVTVEEIAARNAAPAADHAATEAEPFAPMPAPEGEWDRMADEEAIADGQ